jgi:uncharacterized protein
LGPASGGLPIPLHRDFEEINLRFYVRRKVDGEWRRGVVFVREIVPRAAIALAARLIYGEPYIHLATRHRIEKRGPVMTVEYGWRRKGSWESLRVEAEATLRPVESGSHEEFITEHSWGYTRLGDRTNEYEVRHPRWSVWQGRAARLDCDAATLYGEPFAAILGSPSVSCFVADGSTVSVQPKTLLCS